MKNSSLLIRRVFIVLFLLGLSVVFYKTNNNLIFYKKQSIGLNSSYKKLQQEYDTLRLKTKNLKQITVVNAASDSKNLEITEIINTHTNKIDGDISIYFKNLTTSESIIVNGEQKYYMASLYKVILTLYVLDQVENGKTTLDEKVNLTASTSATLAEALDKIITESNNEYAGKLAETYGWETIEDVISKKLGISFRFDKDLSTTIKDMGILFEDITLSLKVQDSESKYLLSLLQDQTKLSKLPKYLPKNILSHNKTGEYNDYSHDAGIFYTPKANYILIFMSKTQNPEDTNEQMAQMSKQIYEVLNQ